MRRISLWTRLASGLGLLCGALGLGALALATTGCGATPMGSPDMTVCGTGGASFSDVKTKVFKASCTISNSCHDATGKMGGLDLATDPYKALLNVKPVWPVPVAEQLVEVAPNSLDKSFLWKKISLATATDPKYGGRMPNTGGQTVSAEQLQIVQCWILGGAPNN